MESVGRGEIFLELMFFVRVFGNVWGDDSFVRLSRWVVFNSCIILMWFSRNYVEGGVRKVY